MLVNRRLKMKTLLVIIKHVLRLNCLKSFVLVLYLQRIFIKILKSKHFCKKHTLNINVKSAVEKQTKTRVDSKCCPIIWNVINFTDSWPKTAALQCSCNTFLPKCNPFLFLLSEQVKECGGQKLDRASLLPLHRAIYSFSTLMRRRFSGNIHSKCYVNFTAWVHLICRVLTNL